MEVMGMMEHSPDFNRKIADALEAAYEKAKHTPTNADRIRAMSDEELAGMLSRVETDGKAYGPNGKAYWIEWLQTPVGGD